MTDSTRRELLTKAAFAGMGACALPILTIATEVRAAGDISHQTNTTDQRIALVRDYVGRVLNQHTPAAAAEFFTADAKWHGGSLGTFTGVQNIIGLLTGFVGALPDIQAAIQDVIASGDLVAMRFVATATQSGDVLGIPKTGKSIQWDSLDIYKITDDGKISEQWSFQDMAAILSQLGAAKLPWAG
jgi:predicted ester cyclase